MNIIMEDEETGEEEVLSVILSDTNSDEESCFTYAAFATCEEAEEVVASIQQRVEEEYQPDGDTESHYNQDVIPVALHCTNAQYVEEYEIIEEPDELIDFQPIADSIQEGREYHTGEDDSIIEIESYESEETVNKPKERELMVRHTNPRSESGRSDSSFHKYAQNKEYEPKITTNKDNYNINCVCPYCGNGYSASGPLKLHMRACSRNEKFPKKTKICNICPKTFKDEKTLKQHMINHNGSYCTRCFHTFSSEEKLQDHIQEHKLQDELSAQLGGEAVQVKVYTCCNCSQQFSVIFKRKDCVKRRYVCDPCRDICSEAEKLKQLQGGKGNGKRKHEYSCDTCDRTFAFMGFLQRHKDDCVGGTESHSSRKVSR